MPHDVDLDRLANLRDVGGRRLLDGGAVRAGVLYRSDQPLPDDLEPPLTPWPPASVIDLRSPHELHGPHPIAAAGALLFSLPILDEADPTRLVVDPDRSDLLRLYARMLRRVGPQFVSIAAAVAETPGPILIHCAAGKDRTGVAVAVLLAAVGVAREEIVEDYQLTTANAQRLFERLVYGEPEATRHLRRARIESLAGTLMTTPRAAIEIVLDELYDHAGGPGGWLLERGLGPAQLEALRNRLVDPSA